MSELFQYVAQHPLAAVGFAMIAGTLIGTALAVAAALWPKKPMRRVHLP